MHEPCIYALAVVHCSTDTDTSRQTHKDIATNMHTDEIDLCRHRCKQTDSQRHRQTNTQPLPSNHRPQVVFTNSQLQGAATLTNSTASLTDRVF